MRKFIFYIILFSCTGCNELINLSGVYLNRISNSNELSGRILVSVKNSDGKVIPNIKISIIEDKDSLMITPSQFTSNTIQQFIFPDEQINSIRPESNNLIILAEHPYYGIFERSVRLADLWNDSLLFVEYELDNIPDTIDTAPIGLYKKLKY